MNPSCSVERITLCAKCNGGALLGKLYPWFFRNAAQRFLWAAAILFRASALRVRFLRCPEVEPLVSPEGAVLDDLPPRDPSKLLT